MFQPLPGRRIVPAYKSAFALQAWTSSHPSARLAFLLRRSYQSRNWRVTSVKLSHWFRSNSLPNSPLISCGKIHFDVSSLAGRIRSFGKHVCILIDQLKAVVTAATELCNIVGFRCFQRNKLRTLAQADELIGKYCVAPFNVAFYVVRNPV